MNETLLETIEDAINKHHMYLNELQSTFPDIFQVSRKFLRSANYERENVYQTVFSRGTEELVAVETHESNRSMEYYVSDIYPVDKVEVVSYHYVRKS